MIEIVMRDDVHEYEAKAFWGHTKREVLSAVAAVAAAAGTVFLLKDLLPIHILAYVLIVEGAIVGIVGVKRFEGGLTFEQYVSSTFAEFCIPKRLGIETDVWALGLDNKLKEVLSDRTVEGREEASCEREQLAAERAERERRSAQGSRKAGKRLPRV